LILGSRFIKKKCFCDFVICMFFVVFSSKNN